MRNGTRLQSPRKTFLSALFCAAAGVLALASAPRTVHADGPAPAEPSITAVRSWSAPSNTRIVFDFSKGVDAVMPDSGAGRQLVVRVPASGLVLAPGVPRFLAVGDSAVDSVAVSAEPSGATFTLWLAPECTFRAFSLPATEDKPFRIVVDVTRVGAQDAENRRLASIAAAKRRDRVRLVYIDAGHGGDDTGARGPGGVYEKNVTLAVARELADQLNKVPGVRALLTRDADFFIPLRQRYKIAEQARADLFISIHCNSSRRRGSGSGTEVYFLSLKGASDAADRDLADIENAADLVGGVPPQAEDDVVGVLYNVRRNSALERSQLLAEELLDHIAADRRVESRGIKQAGFAVLKSVEFPSVLVETAFINNPREVKLLKDPEFQAALGRQLAAGVVSYFTKAGVQLGAPATPATPANPANPVTPPEGARGGGGGAGLR
ncbi:MAG: N-acetylmuramoyl-L-alanine amidase [Candidatus Eisenbacteria bacterium]|uniref:N-acetylmuramoyl-L-alanine amidase n=1 Tax=Eiseniibacteriota bacterium TaxID=2212470 RepID=A0A933W8T8_UNCEI|nr:N-acetylmuramoyl-L-alanine amidase [Candidatus Eisenbacteria bacterium]